MKAVRIHRFGGPEVLQVEGVPTPEPKDGELLVRVHAASLNPVDYKIASGHFPGVTEDRLPLTLGRDLSGVVEKGAADEFKPGDEVMAMVGGGRGAYAEYAIVKPEEAARKPGLLNHIEAAAVPLAAITAWQGLFDHGKLREGERVLIHGGAGGVGHFAIQFAKAKGAFVAATAAGEDLEFVRQLGADQAIDYRNQRFEDLVHDIDLVFDLVAGETQDRSLKALRRGGRLISTLKEPDKSKLEAHGATGLHYMAKPNSQELEEIGGLIDSGEVRPFVAETYPLEHAADAHRALEAGHVRGKIVLICG